MDITLTKGRPEAMTESFYNCVRYGQLTGSQSSWMLITRAKVAWYVLSLQKSGEIMNDAIIYISDDVFHFQET